MLSDGEPIPGQDGEQTGKGGFVKDTGGSVQEAVNVDKSKSDEYAKQTGGSVARIFDLQQPLTAAQQEEVNNRVDRMTSSSDQQAKTADLGTKPLKGTFEDLSTGANRARAEVNAINNLANSSTIGGEANATPITRDPNNVTAGDVYAGNVSVDEARAMELNRVQQMTHGDGPKQPEPFPDSLKNSLTPPSGPKPSGNSGSGGQGGTNTGGTSGGGVPSAGV